MQAELNTQLDEIILIGAPNKMPGFKKYLAQAFPSKKVNFVNEADLALGAALVVKIIQFYSKLFELLFIFNILKKGSKNKTASN